MRSVFDLSKTGFFWWGLIAALVFLVPGAWLVALARFLRSADWLQPDRPPVSYLQDLRKAIDAAASSFPTVVKFNPGESLVVVGPLQVPNLLIGVVVGLVLLIIAFLFYRRATASSGVLDDLVAMVVIYIVLRVEGAATAAVPVVGNIDRQAPQSYLIILVLFMVYQLVKGRGARDSAVFFKVLLEAILVCIMILPRLALDILAAAVEFPTKIHEFLVGTQYFTAIMAGWAIVGIMLGLFNLYNIGRTPVGARSPAGESGSRRPYRS